MYLTDGNLVIRNATTNDAELLCRWWNDGCVMEHAGFPLGLGMDVSSVRSELATDNDEEHRRLIIEVNSIPAGEMSYRRKNGDVAEIGIKICAEDQQDKGYGPRLLRMLLDSLFDEMGYETVILDTNLNNNRARRVYEKLGFKKVATRISSWKNQLGEFQSSVDFELTKTGR